VKAPDTVDESPLLDTLLQLEIFERLRRCKVPAAYPLTRVTTGLDLFFKTPGQQQADSPSPQPSGGPGRPGQNRSAIFIFHDYSRDGFRSGLPSAPEVFLPWLTAVMAAAQKIHRACVVHFDLHPHNVLWKKTEAGGIDLRIVDWDLSPRMDYPLRDHSRDMLPHRRGWKYMWGTVMSRGRPEAWTDWLYLLTTLLFWLSEKEGAEWPPSTEDEEAHLEHLKRFFSCMERITQVLGEDSWGMLGGEGEARGKICAAVKMLEQIQQQGINQQRRQELLRLCAESERESDCGGRA
jgi:hypothetical protein